MYLTYPPHSLSFPLLSLLLCMHTHTHVHLCRYVEANVCMCGGQRSMLSISLNPFPPFFLRSALSLNLMLADLIRLAGQWDPRDPSVSLTRFWMLGVQHKSRSSHRKYVACFLSPHYLILKDCVLLKCDAYYYAKLYVKLLLSGCETLAISLHFWTLVLAGAAAMEPH